MGNYLSMKNNKTFTYSGYSIPKSYILRLKYKKGLDAYTIDRLIFWAVQYCDYKKGAVSLIKALQSGITKGWLFKLIGSDFVDPKFIEWWIDREIYHRISLKDRPLNYCKACNGTGKDWKTKIGCKFCGGSGKKLPSAISDILNDVLPTGV